MSKPVVIVGASDPHELSDVERGLEYIAYINRRKNGVSVETLRRTFTHAEWHEKQYQKAKRSAEELAAAIAERDRKKTEESQ